jgi:valyl-tRNA synthetase
MWNALKLIKMWESRKDEKLSPADNGFPEAWFESRLAEVRKETDLLIGQFRLSEALKAIYSLIWDDFCSWYLEWAKPGFEEPMPAATLEKTISFFGQLMQMLHPFMPFITEEIYHLLKERNDDLCVSRFGDVQPADKAILSHGQLLKDVITGLRDFRNKQQLKPKDSIELFIMTGDEKSFKAFETLLRKQVNAASVNYVSAQPAGSLATVIGKDTFYVITGKEADSGAQKDSLLKELEYLKGFLASVEKKLSNEKFVQNARAEVLDLEKKKKADAEIKIKAIEESLAGLK